MPKIHWSLKKMPSHQLLGAVILLFMVIAFGIGTFSTHGSIAQAFTLATTHQPERYSQLYFDNPARLPSYAPTGKTQTVPFSVVNNNTEEMTYTYRVTTTIGATTTSTVHSLRLANGQVTQLTTQFVIPKPLTKAHIVIQLLGTNEQLTLESTS
jgi:hypothetical protein